jgi:hypothetical protein
VPFDDWSPQFQALYEQTPGVADVEPWEESHVEALFEAGFTLHGNEYEASGLTESDVEAIRAEFFIYMGLGDDARSGQFDWEDWREAMGYGSD